MPRQERLDFVGAIHYVRIHGGDGLAIFYDPSILRSGADHSGQHAPDLREFERLLTAIGEECGVVLLGYSIQPNSAFLVLQTSGAPLDACMRRLCGQYSRYLHTHDRLKNEQSAFATRYSAKLIAPEYLPHAVRRAHRAPIVSRLCNRRVDYPFSSERAYLGERSMLALQTQDLRRALEMRGLFGLPGYRGFMDQAESPYVTELFTRGSPHDRRIVGSKLFVQQVRQVMSHPPLLPTREQLTAAVARLLNIPPADMYSSTHAGVLGRALIAWHALHTGTATLTEVGGWFSVTGATLGQAIHHYRQVSPELFNLPIVIQVPPPMDDDPDAGDPSDDSIEEVE